MQPKTWGDRCARTAAQQKRSHSTDRNVDKKKVVADEVKIEPPRLRSRGKFTTKNIAIKAPRPAELPGAVALHAFPIYSGR